MDAMKTVVDYQSLIYVQRGCQECSEEAELDIDAWEYGNIAWQEAESRLRKPWLSEPGWW